MGKYISGFAKDRNLDKWANYARKNSYGDNKAQCKEQVAPVERGGRENDWSMTGSSLSGRQRGGAGAT
jgi:hypothetical protein